MKFNNSKLIIAGPLAAYAAMYSSAAQANAIRNLLEAIPEIASLIMGVVMAVMVLVGFWFFLKGFLAAIKKTKQEGASISGGEIGMHMGGGLLGMVIGFVAIEALDLFGFDSGDVGSGGGSTLRGTL
jgi:hypothetical protein